MSGANSWLARQRKSDLVELAQTVGLKECVLLSHFFCLSASRKFLVAGFWNFTFLLVHFAAEVLLRAAC
jgi:hypothetical protein